MFDRVSSLNVSSNIMKQNMRLQSSYVRAQTQVASGLKTETFKGLGAQSKRMLDLSNQVEKMKANEFNSQLALDRISYMYSSVKGIIDLATQFGGVLAAAQQGSAQNAEVAVENFALGTWPELIGLLNAKMEDRYLFAGSMTNTAPVDITDAAYIAAQTPPSVVDTSYYQGNDVVLSAQINDTLNINYGVRANDAGFEMLMRAFNLAQNNPNDPAAISESMTLVQDAIEQMSFSLVKLSEEASGIQRSIDLSKEQRLVLDEMVVDIREVDLAEAATRMQQLEVQLEASYATTTRLLRLNLFNYL